MATSDLGAPPDLGTGMSLDDTVGSLFFATMFSMGLWGTGTIQLYFYYNNYQKDATWLKGYVFTVWFLDTLHQALLIGMAHGYLIAGFGNFDVLMRLDPLLVSALLVGGLICALVQAVFVMRIWKLSERNIFLVIFISTLVVSQLGATCFYYAKAVQAQTFRELMGAMAVTRIVNSITAATDSAIALCLVFFLHRARRSGVGVRGTENWLINRLIVFTINTGLVTSLCAILGLILGFVLFETLVFMFFYLSIARLYTNSLLAALNSRNRLRRSLNKVPNALAISKGPTMDEFEEVGSKRRSDDHSPAPLITASQRHSERDTVVEHSIRLDTTVNNTLSTGSVYSQSLYSVVLDDLESAQSTPIKAGFHRTSKNWI